MANHEYRIVYSETLNHLEDAVNEMLMSGWQCVGGLVSHRQGEGYMYCQSMMRAKDPIYETKDNT